MAGAPVFAPRTPQRFCFEGCSVGGRGVDRPTLGIFGTCGDKNEGPDQGRLEAGMGWYRKGASQCSEDAEAEVDPGRRRSFVPVVRLGGGV